VNRIDENNVERTYRKFDVGEPNGDLWKVNSAKDELSTAKLVPVPSHWRLVPKTAELVQRKRIYLARLVRDGEDRLVWLRMCKEGENFRGYWKNINGDVLNKC
jgi:hypothetical protein